MIAKYFYLKILRRINLSKKELLLLKKRLRKENVCYGPFVSNGKMCPTTTALSVKLDVEKFRNNNEVSNELKKLGVSKVWLWLFYFTFDFPSMISRKFFERKLADFREMIDLLI